MTVTKPRIDFKFQSKKWNTYPNTYNMTDTKGSQTMKSCTKQETKTLIIARFGMLECGYNFKAGMSEECNQCSVLDNEDHRLNYCVKFKGFNYCNSSEKVNFEDIYSNDMPTLRKTIPLIERVWNTKCAHGTMNK